jgi:hypothetical protein
MEVIDIGLNDLEPVSLSFNNEPPGKSVNFGPGIELLMNDKKKAPTSASIDLGDLDTLENELNQLSGSKPAATTSSDNTKTFTGFASSFFGFGNEPTAPSSSSSAEEASSSNLGQATSEGLGSTKTWDGYSKMSEVPVQEERSSAKMNEREKRRKKRAMIKKLDEWYEKKLIKNNSHFNMDSPFEEVEDEYETALEDKRKKDSIKLQGWWFMTFVNSVEYANAAFNPFDINLDGWGEQVNEDIDSYEEIFSELHEKYKGGKLAPELSLLLRLGFSAAVVNFTNKALSTSVPGFNDVIRQSPELMKAFTNATVNSMSQQSPGFAFANNLMEEQMNRPRGPPPPAPVETQNQGPMQRPGSMVFTEAPGNRQDINAARGAMFREQGVETNTLRNVNQPDVMTGRPMPPPSQQEPAIQRPEMRGPQNLDVQNILSGLKTRTVDIQQQDDDSMISISSLKDLQNGNAPKRSRRKQRSDKNTVSLDI